MPVKRPLGKKALSYLAPLKRALSHLAPLEIIKGIDTRNISIYDILSGHGTKIQRQMWK